MRGSTSTQGYGMAVLSAAILSTTAVFIRYLTQTFGLPALVLAFWRDVFTAFTLLPILLLVAPRLVSVDKHNMRYLIFYGVVLAGFNSLWTLSVAINGAAVATVLVYCSTAFTLLLGRWLMQEHVDGVKVGIVALSLAGCFLVADAFTTSVWNTNALGVVSGILSGLSYAAYTLMGRGAAQRGLNPWTTLLYTFAVAALVLLLFNLVPGGILPGAAANPSELLWLKSSLTGWGTLLLLAAGPTLLGFGLYNLSLVHLPSSVVNLIVTMEPVFTGLIAYMCLGERFTNAQLIGSAMILAGVMILRIYENRNKADHALPGASK